MPASLLMVAVDWYGPFGTLAAAKLRGEESDVGEFLYLAYEPGDHGKKSYVGLSSNITGRLSLNHHVLGTWPDNTFELWIGIIASQSEPGRRPADSPVYHSSALNFAEHMLAYFVQTSENVRKRREPPSRSGAVFNRWYYPFPPWKRRTQRAHPNWPDMIEFEREDRFARSIWFGPKIDRYQNEEIDELRRKDA
ncbi:hypothetical protein [Bradyrhizobium australafricanum]|uniref:hypothetical protein n=1 Tax=Bradyrhizobium australafricanum TaxID=2821406 RepID=UPI001CE3B35B|nr:hypothetical protein [Bradyrhizobium australafricanum]MCA6097582.1 hypothetical protein [Bradyrhizobium australafricanum]